MCHHSHFLNPVIKPHEQKTKQKQKNSVIKIRLSSANNIFKLQEYKYNCLLIHIIEVAMSRQEKKDCVSAAAVPAVG